MNSEIHWSFFAFQVTESSPEVVPNGYGFTDTLKVTDNETSASLIASSGISSSHVVSEMSEDGAVSGQQEVSRVVERDRELADIVWQNGEVIFGRPLISQTRTESRQQGAMIPRVDDDSSAADKVRQNGESAAEAKQREPSSIRREQETQIRSLHIDDDADDDDVTAAENGRVTSQRQVPGARMFALGRPHAWHQELAKKQHESAAVNEPLIDRQVPLSACLQRTCHWIS